MQKFRTRLKVGSNVEILTGKEKGKNGKILALYPKKNKVLIQGINIKFRHVKSTNQDKKNERKQIELPIDCSNVKIIE